MLERVKTLVLKERYQKGDRDFLGISLEGEELTNTDLVGANFNGANFNGIKLDKVNFQNTSLREADFTETKIIEVDFGAADLSGARFPNSFNERFNYTMNLIKEVSKNLRKICFSLIIISLYIAFTLSHIEDQHLFIKHTQIELPIVNVKIPSLCFLYPAQLVILAILGTLIHIGIKGNWFPLDLEKAHLEEMDLKKYNFRGANLNDANLEKAMLCWVDFRGAKMERSKCSGAIFSCSQLNGAFLNFAKLMKTTFLSAKLRDAYLIKTDLTDANLINVDFSGAKIYLTNFSGVDLRAAKFDGASLISANLKGAKNLTVEQLAKAETLYGSQLEQDLFEQLRERYPYLLEKPRYKDKDHKSDEKKLYIEQ
ncbi:MAG: hypothetical protein GTO45_24070 [Candidatus Aminicenantes bacterium]|nr:hypothetical protein [Candidatus Aminicenantes bacterium]NIM81829.1 hypothetical protein [Candidatus Aminicenantes bacterium]NIN21202.1 hypothetical protein [Candidatus Aminicenantes bacterium]NIN45026.1 hypothetical protein [Candidatus Aminicenantes bacterium]NIN87844.1 hypothetical protein [Candidatus Aminicenantes bacterium]